MYLHVCPVCEHRNPRGSRFCNECGSPLQLRFCPACHAAADVLELKCHACGAKLPEVALNEAADLPPAFAKWATQPPGEPAANRGEASRADKREPSSNGVDKTMRAASQAALKRPAAVAAKQAAPVNTLGPLTAPTFHPQADVHGTIEESPAATFAAEKAASIIERLYAKPAPGAQAAAPEPLEIPIEEARRQIGPSVRIAGALVAFGAVLGTIFFALPSTPPRATRAAPPPTTRAAPVVNTVPAVLPASRGADAQKTPPARANGETIKGPAAGAFDNAAAKPAKITQPANAATPLQAAQPATVTPAGEAPAVRPPATRATALPAVAASPATSATPQSSASAPAVPPAPAQPASATAASAQQPAAQPLAAQPPSGQPPAAQPPSAQPAAAQGPAARPPAAQPVAAQASARLPAGASAPRPRTLPAPAPASVPASAPVVPPAEVSPCTPQVAALGLCTLPQ